MVTNGDSGGDLAPTLCMGEIIVASCHTNNRWQLTYSICILILWPVTNNFFIMHIGSHYELPHLRIFWYLKYNGRQGTKTLICCLSAVAKITICLLFADTTPESVFCCFGSGIFWYFDFDTLWPVAFLQQPRSTEHCDEAVMEKYKSLTHGHLCNSTKWGW